MKVFVVRDGSYDEERTVAVYISAELADAHVGRLGGWVEEEDVLDRLCDAAEDPVQIAAHEAENARIAHAFAERAARAKADAEARANVRPHARMGLCSCATFSPSASFLNAHGYCSYCGGFEPKVFREHLGDARLHEEIDRLNEWDRVKMRTLVA